jgi:hypothetical protein
MKLDIDSIHITNFNMQGEVSLDFRDVGRAQLCAGQHYGPERPVNWKREDVFTAATLVAR